MTHAFTHTLFTLLLITVGPFLPVLALGVAFELI
jgi:hypothetical protein